jgi:tRNA modification GTPase
MPANETIVALSTPAGESALALIRLSGPECESLASAIMTRAGELRPRYAYYGQYYDLHGEIMDSCVFTYFEVGKSFTGEAMLEIATHGNPLIVQRMLADLQARGCRLAEPGEFTRTAFLSGKLDLTQAEAVADLIHARSERSLELAQRQLNGSVGRKMSELTESLLQIMAQLEAYIDFPEEDLPAEDQEGPAQDLKKLILELNTLIETQRYSALLHEGVKALIVGEPNVGKSSLINAFLGSDRAIVSDTPGTTRDYLSAFIMVGPWRVEILDTAGLHEASDDLERVGIQHTMEQSETADFFLLVLDASLKAPTLPEELLGRMKADNTIVLENKSDLVTTENHAAFLGNLPHLRLSVKTKVGIAEVRNKWQSMLDQATAPLALVDGVVLNARHASSLTKAVEALSVASEKFRMDEHSELIAADLRIAIEAIGEVVGRVDNERMLDNLFKQFCIGK